MSKQNILDEINALKLRAQALEQAELEREHAQLNTDQIDSENIEQATDENQVANEVPEPTDNIESEPFEGSEAHVLIEQLKAHIEDGLAFEDDAKQQLHDIIQEVEQQFKQLPTQACLAVFTAGILLGKFLR